MSQDTVRAPVLKCSDRVLINLVKIVAIIVTLVLSTIIIYNFLFVAKVFTPSCPSVYQRVCNGRGLCGSSGLCECDTLYSNTSCVDNQVPGYNLVRNTECSGNGYAYPFILVPAECQQALVLNELVGEGWGSVRCKTYVDAVRARLQARDGNPAGLPAAWTVPTCMCNPGYSGVDCSIKACPVGENLNICSGNGNKTVGIYKNGTNAGLGCQCSQKIGWFQDQYRVNFNQAMLSLIQTTYYTEFSQLYCGQVVNYTVPGTSLTLMYLYQNPISYSCFCDDNYLGVACDEGRCPANLQTNEVCNGNGHPLHGQGLLRNTTKTRSRGKKCDIICQDGYTRCGNKCAPDQSTEQTLYSLGSFCNNPLEASIEKPVKCFDGSLVTIPGPTSHGCANKYVTGSIDVSQINLMVRNYVCANMSTSDEFTACFLNTTTVDGISDYYAPSGLLWNTSYTLTVDLGSPMVYLEFSTNASTVILSNWNGEQYTFTDTSLVAQMFQYDYNNQGNWIPVEENVFYATNVSDQFTITPMPWNYSAGTLFPANYSQVRLTNLEEDFTYVFTAVSSIVNVTGYQNTSYLLVKSNLGQQEPLWFYPTGVVATNQQCLSEPGACSWLIEDSRTVIRSLDFSWYICLSGSTPVLSQEACTVDPTGVLSLYLFGWNTGLVGTTEYPINQDSFQLTLLERNFTTRTSYPVNITFVDIETNVTILDIVLLTLNRVTFPCACQSNPQTVNQTLENEFIFSDDSFRSINLNNLEVDDWVLLADYSSGTRRLLRAQVTDIDVEGERISAYEPWLQESFNVFAREARFLLSAEVISGWPDPNLLLQPFKCPDGKGSSASSELLVIDTSCNCTYANTVTECSCSDATKSKWGCTCYDTLEYCLCGFPATPSYEIDLWDIVKELNVDQCTCLVFTATDEQLQNSSISVTDINTQEYIFLYDINQVPTGFYLHFDTACDGVEVFLVAGSFLFTNVTNDQEFSTVEDGCDLWSRIYLQQSPAYSQLNITATVPFTTAALMFSTAGYDLLASNYTMTFTASSNSANAYLVNYPNGTSGWASSGSEIPTWIEVAFETNLFVDYSIIVFSQLGVQNIETRVFLQGYTNNTWFNIGNTSAYVAEGGWIQNAIVANSSTSYSKYRIINPAGAMGIRKWSLFSNQQCNCPSQPNAHTYLRLDSTEGLVTISTLLEEIAVFEESINPNCCSCNNNCTILIGGEVMLDFARDGICEDAQFVANSLGLPAELVVVNETVLNMTITDSTTGLAFFNVTMEVFPGINAVQFSGNLDYFMDLGELVEFYNTQFSLVNNYVNSVNSTSENGTYTLYSTVYFFDDLFEILSPVTDPFQKTYYLNDTFTFLQQTLEYSYDYLVTQHLACSTGDDCADCGPACRTEPLMTGYTCGLTLAQSAVQQAVLNTSTLVFRTYYVSNFSSLTSSWSFTYNNITVPRTVVQLGLNNCPLQTCPLAAPFMCQDGSCVPFRSYCSNRYTCPANGCVKVPGASFQGLNVYRCACAPGYGGNACQYKQTVPATPYLEFGVPGAETTNCQGPCPLRVHPGVKLDRVLNFEELESFNMRVTYNSAPKSSLDLDYHLLMPICAPYGQVVRYKYVMPDPSGLLSITQRTIWTECPPLRRGYHGEYKTLRDDVQSRNPINGEPVWRIYTNPVTGAEETFPWTRGITSYMDFPFRCSNGDCAATEAECVRAVQLRPNCNGRGRCLADGSCGCDAGWKTNLLTEPVALEARYPYYIFQGVPDPTAWVYSDKWRTYAYSQCTARDCDVVDCSVPTGCFPGTPSLNFVDKLELCLPDTGRPNRCAPSQLDCRAGVGLQLPIKCSGNGIPRQKDYTGEFYCACGTPISDNLSIGESSELVQLIPNGFGGPACNRPYAQIVPIVWSSWDFTRNQQYTSRVTGELLPGIWLAGLAPITPDPADRTVWETCCPGYSRLEYCPSVPCSVLGKIQCLPSEQCLPPSVPLVYRCSNHGVARGDGTCDCTRDEETGEGFTADYGQFSQDNCYREVKCALSEITNRPCNTQPACTEPGNWLHPLSYTEYFEQQWWVCLGGQGLYNNITRLAGITTSSDLFRQQLIQGLGDIATRTQGAINGLQACVCIYSTDTPTSAFGMIPGTSLTYTEAFKFPYKLPLVGGVLTGNRIYSSGYTAVTWTPGQYVFSLSQTANFSVSAIRIFGKTQGTTVPLLTFKDHVTGQSVCRSDPVPFQNSSSDLLNWNLGTTGGALYCGPTYSCLDFRSDYPSEYFIYCLVVDSEACLTWKEQTCLSTTTNKYWPIDDPSVYQGCERSDDRSPGGCTCCKLVTLYAGTGSLTSGQVRFTVTTGTLLVQQIQIYGYTTVAQTPPVGLTQKLNNALGPTANTSCQDDRFYREYLQADGNYFTPNALSSTKQTVLNYTQAQEACVQNGGYLASTLDTQTPSDTLLLSRACNRLNSTGSCWTSAQETKFNNQTTTRGEIFNDDGGCFDGNTCSSMSCQACYDLSVPGQVLTTFSTYPTTPVGVTITRPGMASLAGTNTSFQTPVFSNQISTLAALESLGGSSSNAFGSTNQFMYPKTQAWCKLYAGKFKNGVATNDGNYERLIANIRPGEMDSFKVLYAIETTLTVQTNFRYDWDFIRAEPAFCVAVQFVYSTTENNKCVPGTSSQNLGNVYKAPFYTIRPGWMSIINAANPSECNSWNPSGGRWDFGCNGQEMDGSCFIRVRLGSYCRAFQDMFQNSRTLVADVRNSVNPVTCLRLLPAYPILGGVDFTSMEEYVFDASATKKVTSGIYGLNWSPGVINYPYLPAFMTVRRVYRFTYDVWDTEGVRNDVVLSASQPVYFRSIPGSGYTNPLFDNIYTAWTGFPACNACIKTLNPILQWFPQRYQATTWPNTFTSTTATVNLFIQPSVGSLSTTWTALRSASDLFIRDHMITFYQSGNAIASSTDRTAMLSSTTKVFTDFNSCGYVTGSGFELGLCNTALNYICAYDYTKFTVVSGTQCDQCGANVRTGGGPLPGVTCFDEFALANETAFPLQHEILRQAQSNTLDLYVDDFNLPTDTVDFGNNSIIWGYREAWLRWKADFSNRPGQASRGVHPSLDFCDLSLTGNFPVDCGVQRNPTTNVIERWCASNLEYCNLNDAIPQVPLMRAEDIPPLFKPSDIAVAASDPTCGYPVKLSSFFQIDEWGKEQDDLDLHSIVLQLLDQLVQIQILSPAAKWYNAGKAPYKYVFQANTTSTLAGRYRLDGCSACVSPLMEIILYSTNIEYSLQEPILAVNVSMVKGVTSSFQVSFTVTETDTGVRWVNGERFPVYTFRGVGYRFYNLDTGSTVLLFNPIITNADTVAECTTRAIPEYVEPPVRILSSAPIRKCILTPADQLLFPGKNIGECGCDLSAGDVNCDCPKVLTQLGSLVCGGVGSPGTRVLGPDGQYYQTRDTTTGAGCYVWGPERLADCKTINVGTAVWTLLTPGAVWDSPAVTVDASPVSGASIFINPEPDVTWQTVDNVTELCLASAARLPYYFTADELDQLVTVNRLGRKPILMGVSTPTDTQYPWSDVTGTYFINNLTATLVATETTLDCSVDVGLCAALNWNNLVYGTNLTSLTDGNVIQSASFPAGELSYPVTSSQTVWVVVFGGGVPSCTGGICSSGSAGTYSTRYTCNCPLRIIQYTAASYAEIQIFEEGDLARSSCYNY